MVISWEPQAAFLRPGTRPVLAAMISLQGWSNRADLIQHTSPRRPRKCHCTWVLFKIYFTRKNFDTTSYSCLNQYEVSMYVTDKISNKIWTNRKIHTSMLLLCVIGRDFLHAPPLPHIFSGVPTTPPPPRQSPASNRYSAVDASRL